VWWENFPVLNSCTWECSITKQLAPHEARQQTDLLHLSMHHPTNCSSPVFLNRRAVAQYQTVASIIPGPHLIKRRLYQAAVSKRLRTTVLVYLQLHLHPKEQNTIFGSRGTGTDQASPRG
jgi:hypothetical protein